jgi:hypothetical protein
MWNLGYEAGACLPITIHFEETARSGDSIGSVYGYRCGMSINRILKVTSRM